MDFLSKKLSKADREKIEKEAKEKEETKIFFEELNQFQKEKGKCVAAVVVHDLKGSHVEFTVVPYQEQQ